jgi:hypothetical protein
MLSMSSGIRAQGNRRLYAVGSAPLEEVDRWLQNIRGVWSQNVDALAHRDPTRQAGTT